MDRKIVFFFSSFVLFFMHLLVPHSYGFQVIFSNNVNTKETRTFDYYSDKRFDLPAKGKFSVSGYISPIYENVYVQNKITTSSPQKVSSTEEQLEVLFTPKTKVTAQDDIDIEVITQGEGAVVFQGGAIVLSNADGEFKYDVVSKVNNSWNDVILIDPSDVEEKGITYRLKRELGVQTPTPWVTSSDMGRRVMQKVLNLPLANTDKIIIESPTGLLPELVQLTVDSDGNMRRDTVVTYDSLVPIRQQLSGKDVLSLDIQEGARRAPFVLDQANLIEVVLYYDLKMIDFLTEQMGVMRVIRCDESVIYLREKYRGASGVYSLELPDKFSGNNIEQLSIAFTTHHPHDFLSGRFIQSNQSVQLIQGEAALQAALIKRFGYTIFNEIAEQSIAEFFSDSDQGGQASLNQERYYSDSFVYNVLGLLEIENGENLNWIYHPSWYEVNLGDRVYTDGNLWLIQEHDGIAEGVLSVKRAGVTQNISIPFAFEGKIFKLPLNQSTDTIVGLELVQLKKRGVEQVLILQSCQESTLLASKDVQNEILKKGNPNQGNEFFINGVKWRGDTDRFVKLNQSVEVDSDRKLAVIKYKKENLEVELLPQTIVRGRWYQFGEIELGGETFDFNRLKVLIPFGYRIEALHFSTNVSFEPQPLWNTTVVDDMLPLDEENIFFFFISGCFVVFIGLVKKDGRFNSFGLGRRWVYVLVGAVLSIFLIIISLDWSALSGGQMSTPIFLAQFLLLMIGGIFMKRWQVDPRISLYVLVVMGIVASAFLGLFGMLLTQLFFVSASYILLIFIGFFYSQE